MAEYRRRLRCFMEMSQHDARVGIIEKIDHRAMAAGDENSVVLIQARCNDIRDASWISETSQAVAESEIVHEPALIPAEEIGDSGMEIQLRRVALGVGESDLVAFLHERPDRNRQLVQVIACTAITPAICQRQAVSARN